MKSGWMDIIIHRLPLEQAPPGYDLNGGRESAGINRLETENKRV